MASCNGNNIMDSVSGGIVEEFVGVMESLLTPVADKSCGGQQQNISKSGNLPTVDINQLRNIPTGGINQLLLNGASEGNEDAVKQAVELGVSLTNVRDDIGMSALHLAAWNGHTKIVRLLLEKGASPQVTSKHGSTPVHAACDKGHTDIARLLLDKGGLINAKNLGGMTALHHAAYNDFSVTAAMLLDMGADMGIKDTYGRTPLHLASRQGSVTVACMLLENGANPSPKDAEGHTPLNVAADSQTAACLRKKMSLTSFRKLASADDAGAAVRPEDSTKAIIDSLIVEFRHQKEELADQQDKYSAVEDIMELVKKMELHDQTMKSNISAQVRANRLLEKEHEAERAKVQAVIERHLQAFNKTALSPLDKELKMRTSRDLARQAQITDLQSCAAILEERDEEYKKKLAVFGHLAIASV
jgi:ankyrin repeat protein